MTIDNRASDGAPARAAVQRATRLPRRRPAVARMRAVACAVVLATMTGMIAACSSPPQGSEREARPSGDAAGANARGDAAETGEGKKGPEAKEGGEEAEAAGRVTLSEEAFATARLVVEPVRVEAAADAAGTLEVPGQVEFDPARVAVVSPRAAGRIERLLVVPGDRVAAGQSVALLSSPAFVTAQNDFLQAKRRADVLGGTADAGGARALLAAARRRLELLGVGTAAIARLESGGEPAALLPVPAPFGGSILEASALAGQGAEAGTPLFKIADLSAVNVAADVPERALGALRIGQGASIHVPALPEATFAGRVARIGDQLDPETRTAKALIAVSNGRRALKPGMFATVTLRGGGDASGGASRRTALTVPSSAVVTDGDARYVFVETAPRTYERRAVRLGAAGAAPGMGPPAAGGDDRVVVIDGLTAGERIVARGAFTLKSELAKASLQDVD